MAWQKLKDFVVKSEPVQNKWLVSWIDMQRPLIGAWKTKKWQSSNKSWCSCFEHGVRGHKTFWARHKNNNLNVALVSEIQNNFSDHLTLRTERSHFQNLGLENFPLRNLWCSRHDIWSLSCRHGRSAFWLFCWACSQDSFFPEENIKRSRSSGGHGWFPRHSFWAFQLFLQRLRFGRF